MAQCSNNATPPAPAIAPGASDIDVASFASSYRTDARLGALVPGFDAPFWQAGLAGYSDAAMRLVARRHGCPFCMTEALLDRTLLAGGRGFAKADLGEIEDNVPGGDEDHPLGGQIMGSEPREMAAGALKMIEQASRSEKAYRKLVTEGDVALNEAMNDDAELERTFATIDVNLACPVKKIKSKARGGHWLAHPDGAIAILEAVREAVPESIPTTVKMRRSFDETPEMREAFLKIFDAAYDMGYAWVTVHGRTVEQKYVGPSRWSHLRDLVQRYPDRIIFGSGDVWNAGDIFRMLAWTGVHAVSVARGCIGNPWIFRQARDLMAGREPAPPTIAEQRDVLETHFRLALAQNQGRRNADLHTGKTMRKFAIRFAAHHPDADAVRARFVRVSSLDDWQTIIDEHYLVNDQA